MFSLTISGTMSEERRDGKQPEGTGEPAVQQINFNQVQFEAMMAEITRRMQNTYNLAQQANENLLGVNAGQERDAVAAGAQRARIGPIRGPRVEIGVVGFMENIIKKIQLMKVMMDLRLVSMIETTTAGDQLLIT